MGSEEGGGRGEGAAGAAGEGTVGAGGGSTGLGGGGGGEEGGEGACAAGESAAGARARAGGFVPADLFRRRRAGGCGMSDVMAFDPKACRPVSRCGPSILAPQQCHDNAQHRHRCRRRRPGIGRAGRLPTQQLASCGSCCGCSHMSGCGRRTPSTRCPSGPPTGSLSSAHRLPAHPDPNQITPRSGHASSNGRLFS